MKACKNCHLIFDEGEQCEKCHGQLSKEWQGYVVVVKCEESEIAKKLGVQANGRYALKVR